MNILIVGHTGFIGKNLFERFPQSYGLNSNGLYQNGEKVLMSLDDLLRSKQIDTIINCAVSYSENNLDELHYVNYELPMHLLKLCEKFNITYLMFGSFFEKYRGDYKGNYIDSKLRFKKVFFDSKLQKKYYLALEHIYGPFDSQEKFIPRVVNKISLKEVIILDDPFTLRDYTPVEYVISAVDFVLKNEPKEFFFEIGTSEQITTLQFLKKLWLFNYESLESFSNLVKVKKPPVLQDVIRASSASKVLSEIILTEKDKKIIERNTFQRLFEKYS